MLTPDPTATPAPASDVRPSRDNTSPVVLTADILCFSVLFCWVKEGFLRDIQGPSVTGERGLGGLANKILQRSDRMYQCIAGKSIWNRC